MEIFMNQGRDSTIEPAYLAEKKEVAPEPEPVLIEKTYEVPIPRYTDAIAAWNDNADGYSQVNFVGPSQEDIAANWIKVTVNVNAGEGTVTLGVTDEQLTAAYQSGKRKFYVAVQQEI